MQDHSDLARQGDLRPFRTSPLGDIYPPAFELREPRYARQQNIGGFIERRAHHLIARPEAAAGTATRLTRAFRRRLAALVAVLETAQAEGRKHVNLTDPD